MTFDGGSAEPLGASSPVSLAVRDEAVGLSGVEGLSASGLLARGHARCWGLELAQGLGQCAGEESAVDPEHSHVGAGPHDTLGLVQVHGQSEVAVSQGPGQAVSLRCGVSAVEEDFREGRKRVDDVQAGRDAVADSGAECESRRDLRDWAGTDCWRVGGEVGLVAEEVLCGATVGGGAVSPAGVPVEGVDLPSVRVQLRFVGPAKLSTSVPSIATAVGRSNSGGRLAWMSRVAMWSRSTGSKGQPTGQGSISPVAGSRSSSWSWSTSTPTSTMRQMACHPE